MLCAGIVNECVGLFANREGVGIGFGVNGSNALLTIRSLKRRLRTYKTAKSASRHGCRRATSLQLRSGPVAIGGHSFGARAELAAAAVEQPLTDWCECLTARASARAERRVNAGNRAAKLADLGGA